MCEINLLPCPFCGGMAERTDIDTVGSAIGGDPNAGGSFICCKRCGASSPVHFDRKENLYSSWNDRAAQITTPTTSNARAEIMRLIREDFDPTPPNWEGREWDDNAEDVADKIIAATISRTPMHVSDAWKLVRQWLCDYAAEEAAFSRYRDDVVLDGVMTAGEMRALNDALYVQAEAHREADRIRLKA